MTDSKRVDAIVIGSTNVARGGTCEGRPLFSFPTQNPFLLCHYVPYTVSL